MKKPHSFAISLKSEWQEIGLEGGNSSVVIIQTVGSMTDGVESGRNFKAADRVWDGVGEFQPLVILCFQKKQIA